MNRSRKGHRGNPDGQLQSSVPSDGQHVVDRTGSVLTLPWAWMVLAAQAIVLIAAGPRIFTSVVRRMFVVWESSATRRQQARRQTPRRRMNDDSGVLQPP
jgi:hypothetical protein